jgi:hypothetical protein
MTKRSRSITEGRRRELVSLLLGDAPVSAPTPNPVLEKHVGRSLTPRKRDADELAHEVRAALQEADQPLTPAQIADQISRKCGELADAALARRIGALLQLTSFATLLGTGWWLSGRSAPAPAPAEPKATYHGTVNADAGQAVRENLLLNPRRSAAAVAAHQRPRRPNRNEGPFEPPLRT